MEEKLVFVYCGGDGICASEVSGFHQVSGIFKERESSLCTEEKGAQRKESISLGHETGPDLLLEVFPSWQCEELLPAFHQAVVDGSCNCVPVKQIWVITSRLGDFSDFMDA